MYQNFTFLHARSAENIQRYIEISGMRKADLVLGVPSNVNLFCESRIAKLKKEKRISKEHLNMQRTDGTR